MHTSVKQYGLITANYWAFTLTDGALRMLVVLFFHDLGYSALQIALLFVFYEFFGVITNLVGGWLGARLGLNRTMNIGLTLQLIALSMLLVPTQSLSILWVMAAQALSGIAKDLNKMSAKSAIKLLVPDDASTVLYKWVALLTGSKNTLKGVGFFLGGGLLMWLGFRSAIMVLLISLSLVWLISLLLLKKDLGRAEHKPKFTSIFAKSPAINTLSIARLFLFAARDVWFVVALPVYLASQFAWEHWQVGSFMAIWIIAYGFVHTRAPGLSKNRVDGDSAFVWVASLSLIPLAISFGIHSAATLILGLLIFGAVFAINSSLHSFLIVHYANRDEVSMDVGFYYMANAAGRLLGTVLSGWVYQDYGLAACLWLASSFLIVASFVSLKLPKNT